MPNPLIRQLVDSIRNEPERWQRAGRNLVRDDGVEISARGGYSRSRRPRLLRPREVEFGLVEGWLLSRAIRWWLCRPLLTDQGAPTL